MSIAAKNDNNGLPSGSNVNDMQRFRFSMERAFEPEHLIGQEYRQKTYTAQQSGSQWYYDEFSGLYRLRAPSANNMTIHTVATPQRRRSPARPEPLDSSLTSILEAGRPWPALESSVQVYGWIEEARHDMHLSLKLCAMLMDMQETREGMIPETPSTFLSVSEDSFCKRKNTDIPAHLVASREAYRLLKRLASTMTNREVCGEAQYLLGTCHGTGALGVRVDRERAFMWYTQASKQNHCEATYRTAVCYELGVGTRKDTGRAVMFYRKAAHLTHVSSMYKLGIILLRGMYGQAAHPREAISWLQRAAADASVKNPHALHTLALIQLQNECLDTSLIADKHYAIDLLCQAALYNYAPSQVALGECFEHGRVVQPDIATAAYWYTRAAEAGNAEAALALSGLYLTGATGILEQSDREAYLWARKAIAFALEEYERIGAQRWALAKAYFVTGYYTEHGIGVFIQSKELAMQLYQKAADLGHATAFDKIAMYHLDQSSAVIIDQDGSDANYHDNRYTGKESPCNRRHRENEVENNTPKNYDNTRSCAIM